MFVAKPVALKTWCVFRRLNFTLSLSNASGGLFPGRRWQQLLFSICSFGPLWQPHAAQPWAHHAGQWRRVELGERPGLEHSQVPREVLVEGAPLSHTACCKL